MNNKWHSTYAVYEADNADKLAAMVNAAISDGWMPVGGVCVWTYVAHHRGRENYNEQVYRYAQAIFRPAQDEGLITPDDLEEE